MVKTTCFQQPDSSGCCHASSYSYLTAAAVHIILRLVRMILAIVDYTSDFFLLIFHNFIHTFPKQMYPHIATKIDSVMKGMGNALISVDRKSSIHVYQTVSIVVIITIIFFIV